MSDPAPHVPGVCTPWAELGDLPDQDYTMDPARLEQWLQFASDVLYDVTGRRWPGLCSTTVRPCAARRHHDVSQWWPGDARGSIGTCSCNRARSCGCQSLSELRLADNVVSVDEVLVDGEVVPAPEYGLVDHRYLVGYVKADGTRRSWPCCQRLDLPDTAEGTWSVSFTHGGMPPIGGTLAAASLAQELAKSGVAGSGCRLPKRVTQVVRQNVSVAILDPLTLFQEGRTGLPEVDLWVASVNRGAKERRARLSWTGRGRRQRTTD